MRTSAKCCSARRTTCRRTDQHNQHHRPPAPPHVLRPCSASSTRVHALVY